MTGTAAGQARDNPCALAAIGAGAPTDVAFSEKRGMNSIMRAAAPATANTEASIERRARDSVGPAATYTNRHGFVIFRVAKSGRLAFVARMMATRTRRGLFPAVLALAGLLPVHAEAFEPQRGVAAVYDAQRFTGRPMASGARFHPDLPVAAHRHLPFGTRAEVTNLRTGRTTTVTIADRGPFTPGRILDLSPRAAREIGMNGGLAQVEIRPAPPQRTASR